MLNRSLNQNEKAVSTISAMSRLERKFVISPQFAGIVVAWLRHNCLVDPQYPLSLINSIYFDTPELDSYQECLNGDIYKNKVRLRWYDKAIPGLNDAVYLELKSKRGFNTVKRRKLLPVTNSELQGDKMSNPVSQLQLETALAELGYFATRPLSPIIQISYHRYRFRERQSGVSLTYDLDIESFMVAPGRIVRTPCLEFKATVLELKGGTMMLPPALRGLRAFAPRWSTFSKYAECLQLHLQRAGAAGRWQT